MNGKRKLLESSELVPKKAKFVDEQWLDGISESDKALVGPECQDKEENREASSHGDSTFRANNEVNGDTDSELNDLSIDCFDDFDSTDDENRQPVAGPMGWIQRHIENGTDPQQILQEMLPSNVVLPEGMDMFMMWKLIFDLLTDPQPRQKLAHINTLDHALNLLRTCSNILVLTGAGAFAINFVTSNLPRKDFCSILLISFQVSVSCGIPDFRSRDGIYARLSKEYPDLPDPQAMFDIKYFRSNTKPFYKFAKEIYPGKFKPSLSHRFIHQLEKNNKLLRNYTQNIDTLEREAGITRVIECHGSFSTASCTSCKYKVTSNEIRNDILNQVTPMCPHCPATEDTLSVMKPDIVFFGESLPQTFYDCIEQDIKQVDLLIVIGSSLKVRPVNLIPNQIPANIPQILINREPLTHMNFDVELLGDCDTIIAHMCTQLGEEWSQVSQDFEIPSVSMEFWTPFLQIPPDSPVKEKGLLNDDGLERKCCVSEILENGESLDQLSKEEKGAKDVPHIFLPPCRYVFHGAEIGRCDSPQPFEDDDSRKSNCSSEMNDKIDALDCIENAQIEKEGFKENYEDTVLEDVEYNSEIRHNDLVTNRDWYQSPGVAD